MAQCVVCPNSSYQYCLSCQVPLCEAHMKMHAQQSGHRILHTWQDATEQMKMLNGTALHRAAARGEDVAPFMQHVGERDGFGKTALFYAVLNNHKKAAYALIQHDNELWDQIYTRLMIYAQLGDAHGVRQRLAEDKGKQNAQCVSALMLAATYGNLNCAKILMCEAGLKDQFGWTARMFAARNGYVDCVKLLDIETQLADIWGQSSLVLAVRGGQIDCARVLLSQIEKKIGYSETAFFFAKENKLSMSPECQRKLMEMALLQTGGMNYHTFLTEFDQSQLSDSDPIVRKLQFYEAGMKLPSRSRRVIDNYSYEQGEEEVEEQTEVVVEPMFAQITNPLFQKIQKRLQTLVDEDSSLADVESELHVKTANLRFRLRIALIMRCANSFCLLPATMKAVLLPQSNLKKKYATFRQLFVVVKQLLLASMEE